jgi:hypothetical protein
MKQKAWCSTHMTQVRTGIATDALAGEHAEAQTQIAHVTWLLNRIIVIILYFCYCFADRRPVNYTPNFN